MIFLAHILAPRADCAGCQIWSLWCALPYVSTIGFGEIHWHQQFLRKENTGYTLLLSNKTCRKSGNGEKRVCGDVPLHLCRQWKFKGLFQTYELCSANTLEYVVYSEHYSFLELFILLCSEKKCAATMIGLPKWKKNQTVNASSIAGA